MPQSLVAYLQRRFALGVSRNFVPACGLLTSGLTWWAGNEGARDYGAGAVRRQSGDDLTLNSLKVGQMERRSGAGSLGDRHERCDPYRSRRGA